MELLSPHDPSHNQRVLQGEIDIRAQGAGGKVSVPPGCWPTGSLSLRSGVELHLQHGSCLQACDDPGLFPPVGQHDEKRTANAKFGALLQARGAREIAITGTGTLDGGGPPERTPGWAEAQGMFRPAVAYLEDCAEVVIDSVRVVNSRWWTLHLLRCEDTRVQGVFMRNTWPNSDGIDPDGCRRMVISDCNMSCGDDCIVLKSTQGDACEDILVTNCVLTSTCAALKLGTESLGTFRNVTFNNCVVRADVGVGLYMKDGGVMENVSASQILFDTPSDWPILVDATPRDYRKGPAGRIRNLRIQNCSVRGPGRVWLSGMPDEPLENISLVDMDWHVTSPLPETLASRPLGSARTVPDPGRPEAEQNRAHVIATHVDGFRLQNLRLSGQTAGRDTLWTHNVSDT